jgi:hypothetical protein
MEKGGKKRSAFAENSMTKSELPGFIILTGVTEWGLRECNLTVYPHMKAAERVPSPSSDH